MGACAFPKENKPHKTPKQKDEASAEESVELGREFEKTTENKGKSSIVAEDNVKTLNIFIEKSNIMEDIIEQDDVFATQSASSKIYRRTDSSIIKARPKGKEQNQIHKTGSSDIPPIGQKPKKISQISVENGDLQTISQIVQGAIQQQQNYSKITLSNSEIVLEFTIPKANAGPLLVPFLDYQKYAFQLGHEHE